MRRDLPTLVEPAADLPGYNVYRPIDLDATGGPLPIVVWANGGCVRHDATWKPLLDAFAAAGCFVVAITAPPDREVTLEDRTTAEDQAAAIDWAIEQNAKAGGAFAGQLDTERVVAAGNSCGGITSLVLAGMDPRVRAVFVLSGSSVGPSATREEAAEVMEKVKVPVGFAVGGDEDFANPQARQDYELLAEGIPGYVASRASGDHMTVSTDVAILGEVAEIGVNWIAFAVSGDEEARDALVNGPPSQWTVQAKGLA
jgi:predicted dienelactone hydrolase